MTKKIYFILFFLIFTNGLSNAQIVNQENGTLNISISATEYLPADLIVFKININTEEKTPREAFRRHKEKEALLAKLLHIFEIEEKNIIFEPIRITKIYRNNQNDFFSRTKQQVSVTFRNFDIYEEIQLTLIENNFDTFSGNFSSSEIEAGKKASLISAIKSAQERAKLIALSTDAKLGNIYSITYSEHSVSTVPTASLEFRGRISESAPSLMDFDQVVSVTSNISIQFKIQN